MTERWWSETEQDDDLLMKMVSTLVYDGLVSCLVSCQLPAGACHLRLYGING